MICDVQAHCIPRKFSEFMGDRFSPRVGVPDKVGFARYPFSDSPEDIQGRIELMDRAGVGMQVLSPHHHPYLRDEAEGVKAVTLLNDGYAEMAHRYPKRFASYLMLPLPHIDAALQEMERGLDQLGCVGVNMHILCFGRSVAETEFEPLYQEMNRRGTVLFVHPTGSGIGTPLINDYGYAGSVGTSLVDAVFVLHMIVKKIPYRYPNIKIIVPHLGGPIPMLLNRLDKQGSQHHPGLPELPSVTAKRLWYDTVCYGSKPAFICALEAFGADHLVTGSDYPVLLDFEDYKETFDYINRLGLPQADADRILHHNAQLLFGFSH
jgi:6-methylsalicylate decarboxylase